MSGGLLSLVAVGSQDTFLTGTPSITFWRVVYRRHTNFAIESIEQTFQGAADFGKRVTVTISRNGDLVSNMYLQVTLPALQQNVGGSNGSTFVHYVNSVGHALLKTVEIEIGGQKIDKHYSEFFEIWSELTMPAEKAKGYGKMVGKYDEPDNPSTLSAKGLSGNGGQQTLYIPLLFFFNRVVGQSLPLIALSLTSAVERKTSCMGGPGSLSWKDSCIPVACC